MTTKDDIFVGLGVNLEIESEITIKKGKNRQGSFWTDSNTDIFMTCLLVYFMQPYRQVSCWNDFQDYSINPVENIAHLVLWSLSVSRLNINLKRLTDWLSISKDWSIDLSIPKDWLSIPKIDSESQKCLWISLLVWITVCRCEIGVLRTVWPRVLGSSSPSMYVKSPPKRESVHFTEEGKKYIEV